MANFHAKAKPKTLIEAVRARRIALKMTLREFSKIIRRNMWTVSEWENGRAVPKPCSRKRLIEWLGFDPEANDRNENQTQQCP
jgi:DNA-binding transcriptional regulator YiaG